MVFDTPAKMQILARCPWTFCQVGFRNLPAARHESDNLTKPVKSPVDVPAEYFGENLQLAPDQLCGTCYGREFGKGHLLPVYKHRLLNLDVFQPS